MKRTFYISGYGWLSSYRDFDNYDYVIMAKDKFEALRIFKTEYAGRLVWPKYEPCVQTAKEWNEMCKKMNEKYG